MGYPALTNRASNAHFLLLHRDLVRCQHSDCILPLQVDEAAVICRSVLLKTITGYSVTVTARYEQQANHYTYQATLLHAQVDTHTRTYAPVYPHSVQE